MGFPLFFLGDANDQSQINIAKHGVSLKRLKKPSLMKSV